MKILILDNYDSFTYNLVQYVKEITGTRPDVVRNDKISLDAVDDYDFIILSPGPGLPHEAGIMIDLIKRYASTKKILGVCLGHQAIAEAFGGELFNLPKVYHGVATNIKITESSDLVFKNCPPEVVVGRYHSWAVVKENLPSELRITAVDEHGVIMALSHKTFDVKGVQFHPESIMTAYGKQMMQNFIVREE
jgi:anthranilate synthase component 2